MLGPHAEFAEIAEMRNFFLDKLKANGHAVEGRDIPMARLIAVADTDGEAEQIARRGAEWIVKAYKNESKGMANPVKTIEVDGKIQEVDDIDRYLQDAIKPSARSEPVSKLAPTVPVSYIFLALKNVFAKLRLRLSAARCGTGRPVRFSRRGRSAIPASNDSAFRTTIYIVLIFTAFSPSRWKKCRMSRSTLTRK